MYMPKTLLVNSSSASSVVLLVEGKGAACKADNTCSTADTCVPLADSL